MANHEPYLTSFIPHRAPLVPVFSFGETDLYSQVDNPEGSFLRWVQESWKKVTGVAPVLPIGRGLFQYSFGIVPQRRPVTVVGKFDWLVEIFHHDYFTSNWSIILFSSRGGAWYAKDCWTNERADRRLPEKVHRQSCWTFWNK